MSLPDEGTYLKITCGIRSVITLYSSRGLTQTLDPIDQAAELHRDINGGLLDLSLSQFRKYKTKISCRDQFPPGLDGIWPGMQVTVDCVKMLCVPTGTSFSRTQVTGTSTVVQGSFTWYQPSLTMLITRCPSSYDEWQHAEGWEIEAEEV